jgi:hypothetical protein
MKKFNSITVALLRCLGILSILFCGSQLYSQNLVKNPSFEFGTCPATGQSTDTSHFKTYCTFWDVPNNTTSDKLHTCNGIYNPCIGVGKGGAPTNTNGWQNPRSGSAYAGTIITENNTREYLKGTFSQTLDSGIRYRLDFYMNLSETSNIALKKIGVYIGSDDLIPRENTTNRLTTVTPTITINKLLNDTANWMHLTANFVATGDEDYIIIGSYDSGWVLNTDYVQRTTTDPNGCMPFYVGEMAYYYYDDVSVEECNACEHTSFFLKPEIEYSDTSCCYELFIQSDEDACNVYGVRLISSNDFLSSHRDGEWYTTGQTTDSISWMTNGAPMAAGGAVLVSDICFSPSPAEKTIRIQYLDADGSIMCTDTFTNTCCKNCEEGMYEIEMEGVEHNETYCCVKLNVTLDSNACELGMIDVKSIPGGFSNWIPVTPPIQPGETRDSAITICTDPNASPQKFVIKFRDKGGYFMCSGDTLEVDCDDCCLWSHVLHTPYFYIQDSGYCSGEITAWFDTTTNCDFAYTTTDAPVDLITIVSPSKTIFRYKVPNGTSGIYHVYFISSSGDTLCTKEIKIDCSLIIYPNNCCDYAYIQNNTIYHPNPNFCKGYIRAWFDTTTNCDFAYTACDGPVTQIGTPSASETWFYYNIPAFTSATFQVHFIDTNGDTICTKEIIVDCPHPFNKTGQEELEYNPEEPALYCAPNPTKELTEITYMLPKSDYMKLVVLDMNGKELDILVEGSKEKGLHKFILDMKNYSSGVYVVKLIYKGSNINSKLIKY